MVDIKTKNDRLASWFGWHSCNYVVSMTVNNNKILIMKRAQGQTGSNGNSTSFKNPVCRDTFDSLPRIYGSLKQRIQSNKLNFYEQMHKRSLLKQSQSKERSPRSDSSISVIKKSVKKGGDSFEGSQQSHKQIIFKKVTNFNDKYGKIPLQRRDDKKPRIKSIKIDDHQARIRVKFNTLHNMLPSLNSSHFRHSKPQTLSDLVDEKISKSVGSINPLMHLYKNKSPQNPVDSRFSIKEESQDESPKATISKKQASKQVQLNYRYRGTQTEENQSELYTAHKRVKTEPSEHIIQRTGAMTQFSKRLVHKPQARVKKDGSHMILRESTKFKVPKKEEYQEFIDNYEPFHQGFSLKDISQRQTFDVVAEKQQVYFGLFQEERHGFGVLISEDTIFQGHFDKDLKVKGCQITFDGKYVGKFNKKGLRHGKGKFQWNNGQEYEGDWSEGKKHGYGTWKSPSGDCYEGEWVKGRQNGSGVHRHKLSVYKGQFLNSLKHGNGQEQFKNGDNYRGMYEKGKPNGKGRYDWSDGSYYEGEFKDGYREGRGVLHEQNGCLYKAQVSLREIQNTVLDNKSQKTVKSSRGSSSRVSGSSRLPGRNDCSRLSSLFSSYMNGMIMRLEIRLGRHQRRQIF